jgi:monoamine oxidase
MLDKVAAKPSYHQRVTAIAEVKDDDMQSLLLTIDGRGNPFISSDPITTRKYSTVVCTVPLSVLRTMDLDDVYLSSGQRNAFRELQYSPSIKIGIQFKSAWWEELGIEGGQSYTD